MGLTRARGPAMLVALLGLAACSKATSVRTSDESASRGATTNVPRLPVGNTAFDANGQASPSVTPPPTDGLTLPVTGAPDIAPIVAASAGICAVSTEPIGTIPLATAVSGADEWRTTSPNLILSHGLADGPSTAVEGAPEGITAIATDGKTVWTVLVQKNGSELRVASSTDPLHGAWDVNNVDALNPDNGVAASFAWIDVLNDNIAISIKYPTSLAASHGGVYLSFDRGTTWRLEPLPGAGPVTWQKDGSLVFEGGGGDETLATSEDSGKSWQNVSVPTALANSSASVLKWSRPERQGSNLLNVAATIQSNARAEPSVERVALLSLSGTKLTVLLAPQDLFHERSEERRVGKECD